MWTAFFALVCVLSATALFFFVLTRGALLLRGWTGTEHASSHVYPIYSNMRLIKLVDFQPIISAILLFQYHRLVSHIASDLRHHKLQGQKMLVTSCAFGNVIPRVVEAAVQAGADEVVIADIVENELTNARDKLGRYGKRIRYVEDNATAMQLPDASVAANVLFFLLHELPHPLKKKALDEAARVLTPGGTLYIAEFHRPRSRLLRVTGWLYFKVFEPYGLALWDTQDPVRYLESQGNWQCRRHTCLQGNFQVIIATKP